MIKLLRKEKKGQFSIEYLIAFLLFSIVILYLSFQAAGTLPGMLMERSRSRKDSEAQRIANFLAENEKGLAEEPYQWNKTKMERLQERCDGDYNDVVKSLGLKDTSGVEVIGYDGGNKYRICEGPTTPAGVSIGSSTRFGYVVEEDEINKIEVRVW